MLTKTQADEIEGFLSDASNMTGGHASRVVFPESVGEVASVLALASRARTPVTVAGAGTGVVGGRIPLGGIVLATARLNNIKKLVVTGPGGFAVVEAGVVLADFQRAVAARGLLYPPDPTEWSCYLGGTIATNASGARTFKYGPTRGYVRRLQVVLATGDVLDVRRGEILADERGRLEIPLGGGRGLQVRLPTYRMPRTRKHAAGYFLEPRMDSLDLFIGSEGTLGVITEIETQLLPRPENVLSGVVFFRTEESLLGFVREARRLSLLSREAETNSGIDARALEYFDAESLRFLSGRYTSIPELAEGALFFEQETSAATEDAAMAAWLGLLERSDALIDDSWFAASEADRVRLSEFRHALPVLVNEWLSHHGQRKVSTDMAVPDKEFAAMLAFYKEALAASRLRYVIFGHIGDNHVHVNLLPRDEAEAKRARELYSKFIRRAVEVGGTISAEHGVGKLKREYLAALYGPEHLKEMAALKRSFDPALILGRGNIFAEELL